MSSSKPTLWHIPVSHYSEKARWALAHKKVEHERKAPPPGMHIPIAMALTRSARPTFPVLAFGGGDRAVGDSTAIIAALEERHPDNPLYPDDPQLRRRALELEDYFDEQLGPQIRLLAWHDITSDTDGPGMGPLSSSVLPERLRQVAPLRAALSAYGSAYVKLRFRVSSDDRAAGARDAVVAAFDRLERELDGNAYLVGDTFTVADLTAASLFYPLALPPEGPQIFKEQAPSFERFVAPLRDRPGYAYIERMFRDHR
jgi:glutathione S-transferase